VRRTALALGILFLVDLGFMGQGIFSMMIAVVGVGVLVLASLWSILRGQRSLAGNRAVRAALYLLLGAATLGVLRFHSHTVRAHATRVIEACRAYKVRSGKLPERLQDLVPDFLPAVPRAKYTVMFPPFGRRLYHFEEDRWGQLD
jgi:hypothetical protein